MLNENDIKIKVNLTNNKMQVECLTAAPEYTYNICLVKDSGEILDSTPYTATRHAVFWLTDPGTYYVRVTILDGEQNKYTSTSEPQTFEGVLRNLKLNNNNNKNIFYRFLRPVYRVSREIWKNKSRMIRVSSFDKKIENKDSYLGRIWDFLNPLIQMATFWFVFGIGIHGGDPIKVNNIEYPYLLWMLCGLIPWFFVNNGIVKGATAVFSKASIVLRTKYPLSTLPMGSIIVGLYDHIIMLGILFVFFLIYGYLPTLFWLNLIYYIIFMILFFSALALITSTLTMLARDFQKLINSLIRLLFYLTPILWNTNKLPSIIQKILNGNPILYIVNGFRDSLLYNVNFFEHPLRIVFFWSFTAILFVIGCHMQHRFKDKFIDLM